MPGNRPLGVTIVGLLTLAGAGAVFFLGLVMYAVANVGGHYGGGVSTRSYLIGGGVAALFILLDAMGIILGSRICWYTSIIVWVFMFVYFSYFAYVLSVRGGINFQTIGVLRSSWLV